MSWHSFLQTIDQMLQRLYGDSDAASAIIILIGVFNLLFCSAMALYYASLSYILGPPFSRGESSLADETPTEKWARALLTGTSTVRHLLTLAFGTWAVMYAIRIGFPYLLQSHLEVPYGFLNNLNSAAILFLGVALLALRRAEDVPVRRYALSVFLISVTLTLAKSVMPAMGFSLEISRYPEAIMAVASTIVLAWGLFLFLRPRSTTLAMTTLLIGLAYAALELFYVEELHFLTPVYLALGFYFKVYLFLTLEMTRTLARVDALRRLEVAIAERNAATATRDAFGGLAHMIKNRFQRVLPNVEYLAKRSGARTEAGNEVLQQLYSQSEELGGLLDELAKLYRLRPENMAAAPRSLVLVVPLVQDLVASTRREAVAVEISLALGSGVEDARCTANQRELAEVFLNVLTNAVEAMDGHGKISVELRILDGHLSVRMTDTGRGIPAELREQIFLPGFTLKGDRNFGVGLFQARTCLRTLGGDITVESSEPGETVMAILIPLA